MLEQNKFEDYIKFLRENFENLVTYKEMTGKFVPELKKIKKDLFNDDPFVVFGASLVATAAFSEENIYH